MRWVWRCPRASRSRSSTRWPTRSAISSRVTRARTHGPFTTEDVAGRFGIGAAVGGVGNYMMGRAVVNSALHAFGPAPLEIPRGLLAELDAPKPLKPPKPAKAINPGQEPKPAKAQKAAKPGKTPKQPKSRAPKLPER